MTVNGSQRLKSLSFPFDVFNCGCFLAWFSLGEALLSSDHSEVEKEACGYGTNHKSP